MEWIESAGGPLIMIEDNLIDYWGGVFGPNQENSQTDYDRACLIDDYIGITKVSSGKAIILNDQPLPTSYFISPQMDLVIIRWAWANNEEEVIEHLNNLRNKNLKEITSPIDFNIYSNRISIFDSAWDFPQKDNHIKINMHPGKYKILTKSYRPDEETSLILHEFIKNS